MSERSLAVACFGGRVNLRASGRGAGRALMAAAARLLAIHVCLTRFSPASELSRLNADPRVAVPASPLVRQLAAAVREAGARSDGLVDATTLAALEAAGYERSIDSRPPAVLPAAPTAPRPALPDPAARWREVGVEGAAVVRPPGVRIDSGGLAKGLAADLIAADLADRPSFVVDCGGDLRVGGADRASRPVLVRDPLGGKPVHEFLVTDGAIATSGITRRAWRCADGVAAHHLIDPGRGVPAWTGVVQATALAPTGLEAEVHAKAALLAGPDAAAGHMPHGGVVVLDDASVLIHAPHAAAVAA